MEQQEYYDKICVHLELPDYLRQWLIYQHGGVQPIVFPKLSAENKILEVYLRTLPAGAQPDLPTDTSVAIAIPYFRYKPPMYYNYLPLPAKKELVACIRNRFIMQMWNDLHSYGHIGKRRDNLYLAWMAANGIEDNETNWCAIVKIYQRLYRNYCDRKHYEKTIKIKKKKK